MKVSLNWLADYTDIGASSEVRVANARQLAEALTMRGLEVENISERYDYLQTVRVGRVVNMQPHDHVKGLQVCRVKAGDNVYTVVCGAPNVALDSCSALALPGTMLPEGTTIRSSVVHGVLSEGMLCSAAELGLGDDADGILELNRDLISGTPLAETLNLSEPIFEMGLTPNRADCLCMLGIGREVAAIHQNHLKYPEIPEFEAEGEIQTLTSVRLAAPNNCPRYAARLLEVVVGPAPFWIKNRLMAVGIRPINNIVDITNFVMLEYGQPLHAFDFDHLEGQRIVVRQAQSGETLTTLDNKVRNLDSEMLVICDARRPVALAGIMGGRDSEIQARTTRVLLESAWFNPISIRRTAKKLGVNTDASHRFERGVDPLNTVTALQRAVDLMVRYANARPMSGFIDQNLYQRPSAVIQLSTAAVNSLLGTQMTRYQMISHLESIEFKTRPLDDEQVEVHIPSFRLDVQRQADLAEEVARLAGYDTIPVTWPVTSPGLFASCDERSILRQRLRDRMTGLGFTEIITYSFIGASAVEQLNLADSDARRSLVRILNPLSEDQAVMRTSLVPGLLQTLQRNIAQQNRTARLFEIGNIFTPQPDQHLPLETNMLAGLWSGLRSAPSWHDTDTPCDFYDLKGVLEALLMDLGLMGVAFKARSVTNDYYRCGHAALIQVDAHLIGWMGEIETDVLAAFDIRQPAFVFELDCQHLIKTTARLQRLYKPLPRFPAITRDATLIVPETLEARELIHRIETMKEPLVEDVQLFAVFKGPALPPTMKSVSFRISYRSPNQTLADETITGLHQQICGDLVVYFKALLP